MEGHYFPYKFQENLEKVENDEEQLPFISDESNYSNRSYGLFRSKSSLIMTSAQDFSQNLFLGSFPEGGIFAPPPDQNRGYKRPDQNRVKTALHAPRASYGAVYIAGLRVTLVYMV